MTVRGVEFDLYTKECDANGFKTFGYNPNVIALCTMNRYFEVFTVRVSKFLWGKPAYILHMHLQMVETGREMGQKEFDTADEAIEFGKAIVTSYFPEAVVMLAKSIEAE
jgi:hypothetical protein